jgi:FkbM family methyltransferase
MIQYFDFGLNEGRELRWMIKKVFPVIGAKYTAYGFEACAKSFRRCRKTFQDNKSVQIIQGAVGSTHGGKIRLYHATGPKGHSIYAGKNNVADTYEEVPAITFSGWLSDNSIDLSDTFNIVRYNIEGAEWDLVNDMAASGLFKQFHLVFGAKVGNDMKKCKELRDKVEDHKQVLREHGVKVGLLCSSYFASQRVNQGTVLNRIRDDYEKWEDSAR